MQAKTGAFLNRLLPPLRPAKPVETEVFDPRGTGGSNLLPPSGESGANLISGRNVFDDPGSGPWFGRFDLLAQHLKSEPLLLGDRPLVDGPPQAPLW